MATMTSSTFGSDQGKWIQDKVLELAEINHRIPQLCDGVKLPGRMGKTANFTRYNRINVVVDKLTEGVTPDETDMSISTQTITVDQWGLFVALADVGIVTTYHPILNQALNLVADAVARTVDYNLIDVLTHSTVVQYWDGSRANRAAITNTDVFEAAVFNKARSAMQLAGARFRMGSLYAVVVDPDVEADILQESAAVGSFGAAHQLSDNEMLEKGYVKDWLGFRVIVSNFLPIITLLTTFTGVVASNTASGALSGTVYYKITRKSLQRGFEEDIAAEVSVSMGSDDTLTFTAPSTSGYVYNIYAGSSSGDANLFLVKENLAASGVFVLTALATSGTNPPETGPSDGTNVHLMFAFGANACDNVELEGMSMEAGITPVGRTDSDPLAQRRKVGAKWMHKGGIRNSYAFRLIQLASNFS